MRPQLHYAMKVMRKTRLMESMDALGVPRPDLEMLVGPEIWGNHERHRVRRAMDSVMYGSLDVLGIQRFMLSAEFIAAWIALVVHPTNHLIACAWYHGAQTAEALLGEPEMIPIAEGVRSDQLLALVVEAIAVEDLGVGEFHSRLQDAVAAGELALMRAEAVQAGGR